MTAMAKLYDRLAPMERLSAFLAAASRRDTAEMDRLNDTCPRKTYVMDDYAYAQGKHVLWHLAAQVQMLVDRRALVAATAMLALVSETMERGAAIERLADAIATAKGCVEGWDAFCAEVQLDGPVVFEAFGLRAYQTVQTLCFDDELAELPGDDEARDAVLGFCRHAWSGVV